VKSHVPVPASPLTVTLNTQSLSDWERVCRRESSITPESAPIPEHPNTAVLQAAAGYPYMIGLPLGQTNLASRRAHWLPCPLAPGHLLPPARDKALSKIQGADFHPEFQQLAFCYALRIQLKSISPNFAPGVNFAPNSTKGEKR
jgi:hypothetical protein